ncbi:MAG: cell division protein FtsA [Candidatus Magasanikbacteria bacterium RIFCSPHIGHO2_02_FULL_47_14]|uniref:Cell division protein FtsA n=1 Tax=Candidatus Magasanikbacteria bacterium RIFCSPHIGHO2_02_FULL_47_14 TaxID=1798680 RepID=A0A1F6M6Z3_9BACT|nr:MAG: cell division protein FtsA [Candidatus Magasanikbacteria bacterium RIFCSPHIGHO2_02_FULL_47_14]
MARTRGNTSEIITGLDIGSTGIRVAVGQYTEDQSGTADLQIIGTAEVGSSGIQKGVIVSIEEAVSAVSHVLEEAERLIGVPIEHGWVGISGTQILSQGSRGVVAVAKSDGEISGEDVMRVIDAAQTVAAPLNYEVLHVLPKHFTVDGQMGLKDPVGMTGVRLEVDAQIIYGATPYIKNVTKAIYRTGIEIDDLVVSILATADVVATQKQKELGVVVVDIGGSTTSVVVYEEGNSIHMGMIPIGSNHITNDLALGLQTPIEVAERLKIAYGDCLPHDIKKQEMIDLSEFGASAEVVSKKFVAEIIYARVSELLDKVNEELTKINRQALLPAGVLFTGGGAKLHGLIDVAREQLQMNAAYGFPRGLRSATEKINDLSYTPAIGLVSWGALSRDRGASVSRIRIPGGGDIGNRVKKLFKFLIP